MSILDECNNPLCNRCNGNGDGPCKETTKPIILIHTLCQDGGFAPLLLTDLRARPLNISVTDHHEIKPPKCGHCLDTGLINHGDDNEEECFECEAANDLVGEYELRQQNQY